MDRKTAKLIRAFCHLTSKSYRDMKRSFSKMSKIDKMQTRRELQKFYMDNMKQNLIPKKYADLKKPLTETLKGKTNNLESVTE